MHQNKKCWFCNIFYTSWYQTIYIRNKIKIKAFTFFRKNICTKLNHIWISYNTIILVHSEHKFLDRNVLFIEQVQVFLDYILSQALVNYRNLQTQLWKHLSLVKSEPITFQHLSLVKSEPITFQPMTGVFTIAWA